jgi:hypothetical protein
MKKSAEIALALLAALYLAAVACFYARDHVQTPPERRFGDLGLRASEVACAHEGIDSFRIWNREIVSDRYCPAPCPGRPHVDAAGRRAVHAYPPWHTVFFWFWGYLSPTAAAVAMCAVNLLLLAGLGWAALTFSPKIPHVRYWMCVLGVFFLADPVCLCVKQGNYGILLAAVTVLMYWALEKRHDVLAGLCWAVMMIKPQVGVLFFWPLFFQRRGRVVTVAAVTCLVLTGVAAKLVNASPWDMIARMSEIGKPYMLDPSGGAPHFVFASKILGRHVVEVVAACGFVVCGVLCFWLRTAPAWWIRTLPAAVLFPFWTYSKIYDNVVAWNFFLLAAGLYAAHAVRKDGFARTLKVSLAVFAGVQLLVSIRLLASCCGFDLSPSLSRTCLYAGLFGGYCYWLFAAGCLFWAYARRAAPFAPTVPSP